MGRKLKGKSGKKGGTLRQQLLSQVGTKKKVVKEVVEPVSKKKQLQKLHQQEQHLTFIPFTKDDSLLLVGEGDFSFAKSIVERDMLSPENLVATSFDSRDELSRKYADNIDEILKYLNDQKVVLYHNVDGQSLIKSLKLSEKDANKNNKILNNIKIDNIMFNFPHTGKGMKDVDRNIKLHQELMVNFFQSCQDFYKLQRKHHSNEYFNKPQKIIITLFEGEPYDSWGIKKIAKNFNYKVERSGNFNWDAFVSYHHRRTNGTLKDTSKPATQRKARIYVFEENLTTKIDDDLYNESDD